MGWHKSMSASERRRVSLRAHKGDKLATARALQVLANVTTDVPTRRAAHADAMYFYSQHNKEQKAKSAPRKRKGRKRSRK